MKATIACRGQIQQISCIIPRHPSLPATGRPAPSSCSFPEWRQSRFAGLAHAWTAHDLMRLSSCVWGEKTHISHVRAYHPSDERDSTALAQETASNPDSRLSGPAPCGTKAVTHSYVSVRVCMWPCVRILRHLRFCSNGCVSNSETLMLNRIPPSKIVTYQRTLHTSDRGSDALPMCGVTRDWTKF